jgi:hypothetical protein
MLSKDINEIPTIILKLCAHIVNGLPEKSRLLYFFFHVDRLLSVETILAFEIIRIEMFLPFFFSI